MNKNHIGICQNNQKRKKKTKENSQVSHTDTETHKFLYTRIPWNTKAEATLYIQEICKVEIKNNNITIKCPNLTS